MHPVLAQHRLLSLSKLSGTEARALLDAAAALQQTARANGLWRPLCGRRIALLCAEPTEDVALFERSLTELGGSAALLDPAMWRDASSDRLLDTVRLLGKLYDAVDCCGLPAALAERINRHAGVPVFGSLAVGDRAACVLAASLTMREASARPLEQLRVRLDGNARSASYRRSRALLARVGIASGPLATGAAGEAADERVDFVLDTSAPPSRCLAVPNGTAPQVAHVERLLADNRRFILQAILVAALA